VNFVRLVRTAEELSSATSYQQMLKWYGKLAPLQDKIFKYMKREIEDMDESERWRLEDEEEEEKEEDS
jgi:hypothetical protein